MGLCRFSTWLLKSRNGALGGAKAAPCARKVEVKKTPLPAFTAILHEIGLQAFLGPCSLRRRGLGVRLVAMPKYVPWTVFAALRGLGKTPTRALHLTVFAFVKTLQHASWLLFALRQHGRHCCRALQGRSRTSILQLRAKQTRVGWRGTAVGAPQDTLCGAVETLKSLDRKT